RYNRHVSAAFGFGTKLNASIRKREQRVVLTHADIGAGVPLGATLARDDAAGDDDLAAELFQSEAPARRVAAVTRGSACFLMSHRSLQFLIQVVAQIYDKITHFFLPLAAGLAAAFFAGALAAGFFAAAFFAGALAGFASASPSAGAAFFFGS